MSSRSSWPICAVTGLFIHGNFVDFHFSFLTWQNGKHDGNLVFVELKLTPQNGKQLWNGEEWDVEVWLTVGLWPPQLGKQAGRSDTRTSLWSSNVSGLWWGVSRSQNGKQDWNWVFTWSLLETLQKGKQGGSLRASPHVTLIVVPPLPSLWELILDFLLPHEVVCWKDII